MSTADDSKRVDAIGRALGRIPSGIFVVSCGVGDDVHPFIASWVMQASFEPPAISVVIEDERHALEVIAKCEGRFTLSVLPEDGHNLMKPFFGGDGSAPFGDLRTRTTSSGGVYLADSTAWLDCREVTRCRVGKHNLLVGEVTDGNVVHEGAPLVHVRKHGFSY